MLRSTTSKRGGDSGGISSSLKRMLLSSSSVLLNASTEEFVSRTAFGDLFSNRPIPQSTSLSAPLDYLSTSPLPWSTRSRPSIPPLVLQSTKSFDSFRNSLDLSSHHSHLPFKSFNTSHRSLCRVSELSLLEIRELSGKRWCIMGFCRFKVSEMKRREWGSWKRLNGHNVLESLLSRRQQWRTGWRIDRFTGNLLDLVGQVTSSDQIDRLPILLYVLQGAVMAAIRLPSQCFPYTLSSSVADGFSKSFPVQLSRRLTPPSARPSQLNSTVSLFHSVRLPGPPTCIKPSNEG